MQSTITAKQISAIAQYRRAGFTWKKIAKFIGVPRRTLSHWRKQAKTATKGNLKKLREELINAEAGIITAATQTVIEAATETRVTKIQVKDTHDKDGNPITETTTTTEGANAHIALKVLERRQPDPWSLKHEIPEPRNQSGSPDSNDESRVNELDDAFEAAEGEAKDDTE